MVDYLIQLVERLGPWGYVIIFLVVMLECQPALGFFMPGETLVVIGGMFAAQGQFDVNFLIVGIALAAIVGDTIGFELGLHLGRGWLVKYGRWCGVRETHLSQVEHYFARHGRKSVFAGHFMHIFRALMPFMAGASRMSYGHFVWPNALGCILWAATFTLLGYFFGASLPILHKWIGRTGVTILLVALLCGICYWLWHGRRKRRRAKASVDAPAKP